MILKSQAHVVGDIYSRSLAIEGGAHFDGRSIQFKTLNARNQSATGTGEITLAPPLSNSDSRIAIFLLAHELRGSTNRCVSTIKTDPVERVC